jgi:nitroreductase
MDAFQAIKTRQGVLRYRAAPVENKAIDRVLRAAIAAPSPVNTQPWAFVVVKQPSMTRRVAEHLVQTQEELVFRRLLGTPEPFITRLMALYDELAKAPCFIVLCRQQRVDLAPPACSATVRDWELCSLGAAMANLMVAANDLGLGTRWFGSVMMEESSASLKRMLEIPDEVEVVAVTPLGYHDEPPKQRPVQAMEALSGFQRRDKRSLAALLDGKLALEDVVHIDTFGSREVEA